MIKCVVHMGTGCPSHDYVVDRATSINDIKTMIAKRERVGLVEFRLMYVGGQLEDPYTVGDIVFGDADEVDVQLVMDKRDGVFCRNEGEVKWIIHGSGTNFQVMPMQHGEGFPFRSSVFGIVTTHSDIKEVDGKKHYKANMYKANPNRKTLEYRQIIVKGDGPQTEVFKVKIINNIETEVLLTVQETVVYDEAVNKPEANEDFMGTNCPMFTLLALVKDLISSFMDTPGADTPDADNPVEKVL